MSCIGTKILWPGEGDVLADIWFVHGLRGDRLKTWTKDNVCWPKDLLKQDVPQARTITWGYDADILNFVKPAGQASIFAHAENLLTAVMRLRLLGNDKERSRPIIFVGHSLGGLVIKQALIRAAEYHHNDEDPDKGTLYPLCKGVIFLGTPHRGSDTANLGSLAANVAKAVLQRPNKGLLQTLAQGSHFLEGQEKSFASIGGGMVLVCIHEELEVRGMGMIVPQYSASLGWKGVKTGSVYANHMDMCKFSDIDDPGYQTVSTFILLFMKAIMEGPRLTPPQRKSLSKIRRWLAPSDMEDFHYQAYQKRVENTGNWLLADAEGLFARWKSGQNPLLWLYGKAGCGKTILCSSIVEDIKKHCAASPQLSAQLAFFYFSFTDSGKQSYNNLLRSYIAQLMKDKPPLSAIENICDSHSDESPKPYLEDMLCEILSQSRTSQTFLIIDALDECPTHNALEDRSMVLGYLQTLLAAKHGSSLRLLVTSRQEPDIEQFMREASAKCAAITTLVVDPDIRRCVRMQIETDGKLRRLDEDVKDMIRKALADKSDGMFRWAYCLLEELRKAPFTGPEHIREILDDLPQSLDDTYDRMLQRISSRYFPQALTALQWLIVSRQPLTLQELSEACRINPVTQPYFDVTKHYSGNETANLLSSLVVVQSRHDYSSHTLRMRATIQLAHSSVKEYLLSSRILQKSGSVFGLNEEISNAFVAESCVTYLHHWSELDVPQIHTLDFSDIPLLKYALEHWYEHSRLSCRPQQTERQVTFLSCELHSKWHLILNKTLSSWSYDCTILGKIVKGMIGNPSWSPREKALFTALGYQLPAVAEQLMKGMDIARSGSIFARSQGPWCYTHPQVLDLFLSIGMDPNIRIEHQPLLVRECRYGPANNVVALIKAGADVNARDTLSRPALHVAVMGRNPEIVKSLLNAGADLNMRDQSFRTALQAAACEGSRDVVQILINAGADVNAKGGVHGTALQAAICVGSRDVFQILINAGADVNANGGFYGNALYVAAGKGRRDIVQALLDAGAGANAEGEHFGNALQAAVREGSGDTVEALIHAGADVSKKGGAYGNALQAAAKGGFQGIFQALIDAGADIHAEGGAYGTTLQAAAAATEGSQDILQILIAAGVNVNAEGGYYGNALQAAITTGNRANIRGLIDAGADVDARGGPYGNALQSATFRSDPYVFQALVDAGVDVHAEARYHGNALHAAWCSGGPNKETICKILIAAGAKNTTCTLPTGNEEEANRRPCHHMSCSQGQLAAFFAKTTTDMKGVAPSKKRKAAEANIGTSDESKEQVRARKRMEDESEDESRDDCEEKSQYERVNNSADDSVDESNACEENESAG